MSRTYALYGALLLLAGCNNMLEPGTRVSRPRVMGARVHLESDPGVASLLPGQPARIEWLLASPTGSETVRSTFIACVAAPVISGQPRCAGPPIAAQPAGEAAPTLPDLSFLVPPAEALLFPQLLVEGVVCEEGEPTLSGGETPARCEGAPVPEESPESVAPAGTTIVALTLGVDLSDGASPNRHPTLADERFTVDGAAWEPPPEALPFAGCVAAADPAIPVVRPAEFDAEGLPLPVILGWSSSASDRETYIRTFRGDPPTQSEAVEELQITSASTAGELAGQFTVVDGELTDRQHEMEWRWPELEELPAEGLLVRFFFVSRDLRGGIDWVERALCAAPEAT